LLQRRSATLASTFILITLGIDTDQGCRVELLLGLSEIFHQTVSVHVNDAAAMAFTELVENGLRSKIHLQRFFRRFHNKFAPTSKTYASLPLKFSQRSITIYILTCCNFKLESWVIPNVSDCRVVEEDVRDYLCFVVAEGACTICTGTTLVCREGIVQASPHEMEHSRLGFPPSPQLLEGGWVSWRGDRSQHSIGRRGVKASNFSNVHIGWSWPEG